MEIMPITNEYGSFYSNAVEFEPKISLIIHYFQPLMDFYNINFILTRIFFAEIIFHFKKTLIEFYIH